MKKLLLTLVALMIVLSFQAPSQAMDVNLTTYPNPVFVSVQKASSLTLTPNSNYQLTNNQTGTSVVIPANTAVSVKANGTAGVAVSFTGVSQSSTSGFWVQELVNTLGTPSIIALSNGNTYRGSFSLKMNGSYVEAINNLDVEDYVKGVVPNEMPPSWAKEALKAQAIASRSYAIVSKSTLSSTVASQVYKGYGTEDSRSNAVVDETKGVMVRFAGKPIQALFYAASGGMTANYADVWNPAYASSHPYLVSVSDPFENSIYTSWKNVKVSAADILTKFGFPSGTKMYNISLAATGKNGEVSGVTVKTSNGDKTITGDEMTIRKLFPIGSASNYNMLYSNWFTLGTPEFIPGLSILSLTVQTSSGTEQVSDLTGYTVQTADGTVVLEDSNVSIQTSTGIVAANATAQKEIVNVIVNGKGFGHRLGMSQYGAKGYAENGWNAVQILKHYYVGTEVY